MGSTSHVVAAVILSKHLLSRIAHSLFSKFPVHGNKIYSLAGWQHCSPRTRPFLGKLLWIGFPSFLNFISTGNDTGKKLQSARLSCCRYSGEIFCIRKFLNNLEWKSLIRLLQGLMNETPIFISVLHIHTLVCEFRSISYPNLIIKFYRRYTS